MRFVMGFFIGLAVGYAVASFLGGDAGPLLDRVAARAAAGQKVS